LIQVLGYKGQSVFLGELCKIFRELLVCVTVEYKRFVFEPWDMWWWLFLSGLKEFVTLLANLFILHSSDPYKVKKPVGYTNGQNIYITEIRKLNNKKNKKCL